MLQTVAETAQGVVEWADALDRHLNYLRDSGELSRRRQARLKERVREAVERRMHEGIWQKAGGQALLDDAAAALESGQETPYTVADRIVRAALADRGSRIRD